jgi:23S rRNA pseudouridine2605 synthase
MPTIYQLPALSKVPFHFSSIGRLDFRSEGLLLLTNDGELVQRLTHPRYQVERTYQVLVSGKLDKEQLRSIRSGLTLDDGPVEVKKITYVHGKNLGKSRGSWYFVTVAEGRNRLIRRLFERFDCKVIRLIRISYGQLQLPEGLRPGEIRSLRSEQIKMLKKVGEESKR